ncbi:unnamed protein product [Caenorhabditis sp. 36 PRJEB53466]|nr:unnamed protein product [Caenorhabditis sp. 36 PRJEB53466]
MAKRSRPAEFEDVHKHAEDCLLRMAYEMVNGSGESKPEEETPTKSLDREALIEKVEALEKDVKERDMEIVRLKKYHDECKKVMEEKFDEFSENLMQMMEHRVRELSDTMDAQMAEGVRETMDAKLEFMRDHNKMNSELILALDEHKIMIDRLSDKLELAADPNGLRAALEEEQLRAEKCRKEMLEMAKVLEGRLEVQGLKMPWKECDVCLEQFNDLPANVPRVLGCGHTVCHSCAQKLAKEKELLCPLDRKTTELKCTDVTCLPKNFKILQQ